MTMAVGDSIYLLPSSRSSSHLAVPIRFRFKHPFEMLIAFPLHFSIDLNPETIQSMKIQFKIHL
jgi:hypothetical protein